TIRKFRRVDGGLAAEIGITDDSALKEPARLIFGPDGYLYAAVFDRIVVLTKDLSVLRTFSTTVDDETESWVSAMAFGPDDCLYVYDLKNHNFKKFGPDGSFIQKFSPLLYRPESLCL
ncbi:MAG TPA: hypothetical protein DHW84_11790, partial [Firmicutes bacterium]|nr:hypothetical protein [Bacillota bacterium]